MNIVCCRREWGNVPLLLPQQQITIIITVINKHITTIIYNLNHSLSLSLWIPVANSEWRGNQAALHPLVQRRGRRKKSGRRRSRWVETDFADDCSILPLFLFIMCLIGRVITQGFVICCGEFQLFWCEYSKHTIRYCSCCDGSGGGSVVSDGESLVLSSIFFWQGQ